MKTNGGFTQLSRRGALAAVMTFAVLVAMPFTGAGAAAPAAAAKPKIGIIGSGNVGSNLGRSWAKAGYPVMFFLERPRGRQEARRTGGIRGPRGHRRRPRLSAMYWYLRCPMGLSRNWVRHWGPRSRARS